MIELLTDDEALREEGMTDGAKKVGKFKLRPMTPVSLSWCQRNNLFDDETGEAIPSESHRWALPADQLCQLATE